MANWPSTLPERASIPTDHYNAVVNALRNYPPDGEPVNANFVDFINVGIFNCQSLVLDGALNVTAGFTAVNLTASGTIAAAQFTGPLTGNVTGNLTGVVTGSVIGTATTFTGALTGDVTSAAMATTVVAVGGKLAAAIAGATITVEAAASTNTPGTLVKRDSSGNFIATEIWADLTGDVTGNVTGNVSGSAASFTGALAGDVTSTGMTTTVAAVGGKTAAAVAAAVNIAHAQNTDTGTNSFTFAIASVTLKDASGTLHLRNAADSAYASLIVQDLTVQGTTTMTSSNVVNIGDSVLTLNADYVGSAPSENAGLEIERGTVTSASLIWDETADLWKVGLLGSETAISLAGHAHASSDITDATNANTASMIVKRDGSGNFSAGTISAALTGNVAGNLTGNVTGNITGAIGSFSDKLLVGMADNGSDKLQVSGSILAQNGTQTGRLYCDGTAALKTTLESNKHLYLEGGADATSTIDLQVNGATALRAIAGRVLVGTITDDGTHKLQVNGGIAMSDTYVGPWTGGASCAAFTNSALYATSSSYALIQDASGNTALNSAAAQAIYFRIGGGEAMKLATSGRFLIGTTTDDGANLLQVNGSARIAGAAAFGSTVSVTGPAAGTSLYLTDAVNSTFRVIHAPGELRHQTTGAVSQVWQTDSTTRMTLTGTGNLVLGAGTDNGFKLQIIDGHASIVNATRPTLRLESTGITTRGRVIYGLAGQGRLDLTSNVYYDGAAWTRDDATKAGARMVVTDAGIIGLVTMSTAGVESPRIHIDGTSGVATITANTTISGNLTVTGTITGTTTAIVDWPNITNKPVLLTPTLTPAMGTFTCASATVAGHYNGAGIQIRETLAVTNTQTTQQYAPRIGFHWATSNAAQFGMDSNAVLTCWGSMGDTLAPLRAADIYVGRTTGGSTQGGIIDLQGVNDVAGDTYLRVYANNRTQAVAIGYNNIKTLGTTLPLDLDAYGANRVRLGMASTGGVEVCGGGGSLFCDGPVKMQNYGLGLVGLHLATKYQAVFSIDSIYQPTADGSGLANHYGLVWAHPLAGGQTRPDLDHQLLINAAGVTKVALGSGIWTSYGVTAATYNGLAINTTGNNNGANQIVRTDGSSNLSVANTVWCGAVAASGGIAASGLLTGAGIRNSGDTIYADGWMYLEARGTHMSFWRQPGTWFSWHTSSDGSHGGASQVSLATLDDQGAFIPTSLKLVNSTAAGGDPGGGRCRIYVKGHKLVTQYNTGGGSTLYRSMDLLAANAVWTYHGTTEPS